MPRVYTVPLFPIAVTTSQDLFEVTSASDKITEVLDIHLSQSSEVGDAQEEGLTIITRKEVDTSGSGGTTVTPTPMSKGDANFSGVCEVGNTTKAGGSPDVSKRVGIHNWNIRVPLDIIYLPEERPEIAPNGRFVVELYQNPADPITIGGYMTIMERG